MTFRCSGLILVLVIAAGILTAGPVSAQQAGEGVPGITPPEGTSPSDTTVIDGQYLAGGVLGTSGWYEQTADGRTILFPQIGTFGSYTKLGELADGSAASRPKRAMDALQGHMIMPPIRGWYFIAPNGALIFHPVAGQKKTSE